MHFFLLFPFFVGFFDTAARYKASTISLTHNKYQHAHLQSTHFFTSQTVLKPWVLCGLHGHSQLKDFAVHYYLPSKAVVSLMPILTDLSPKALSFFKSNSLVICKKCWLSDLRNMLSKANSHMSHVSVSKYANSWP